MTAVPSDQISCRDAARKLLPLDAETTVTCRAVGEHDRVVVAMQFGNGDVAANLDIAEESHARPVEKLLKGLAHRTNTEMVGRDTVTHQPKRAGQPIKDVDADRDRSL